MSSKVIQHQGFMQKQTTQFAVKGCVPKQTLNQCCYCVNKHNTDFSVDLFVTKQNRRLIRANEFTENWHVVDHIMWKWKNNEPKRKYGLRLT